MKSPSSSRIIVATKEEKQRNRSIEKILREEENGKKTRMRLEVLMINSDVSSKAAFLELLHSYGGISALFSERERELYRQHIFRTIMDGLRQLLDSMDDLGLRLSPGNKVYAELVDRAPEIRGHEPYPREYYDALKMLWNDAGVKAILDDRDGKYDVLLTFPKHLVYFIADLDRLFNPAYQPTDQDIINSPYLPTQGVTETVLTLREHHCVFIDISSQKTERRKWMHMFQGVTCILFFVSLNCYDQSLPEDPSKNQMNDVMSTWDAICQSQWFMYTSIILMFTELESFKAKFHHSNMKMYFPDYDGAPGDARAGCSYFKKRFTRLAQKAGRSQGREVYVHVMDFNSPGPHTECVRVVLAALEGIILRGSR